MKNERKKHYGTEGIFEDYATRPVPEKRRFGWLPQGMAWSGVAFCLAMFSVGGILASSMSLTTFVAASFLGAAIVTVIGTLIGGIGVRTHMASAFNSRFTLGVAGGKIFGLVLAISLFGWFGYQCYYFASSMLVMLKMFGYSGGSFTAWVIVGGLLMMITAVVGFRGITLISGLSVPLLFLLVLIAAGITIGQTDFPMLQAASAQSSGSIGLSGGVVTVVSCYISGTCVFSDLTRFSKRTKDSTLGGIFGLMIAFPALLLLGGFFYYAYGTSELCEVFVSRCGMGMFVPFMLVISTWTTNDFNLYCSVLGISNILDDHVKLPRWLLTLVVGTVSTLFGAFVMQEAFTSFLNLLGVFIPPVAAVIIADYYLYNRSGGLYAYENMDKLQKFRGNTCFSAIVGILVGLLCSYGNIGFLRALCSVFPSCIVAMLASVLALVIYNTVTRSGKVIV